MTARGRIAVLFHKRARDTDLRGYIVWHLAQFWREDGLEVDFLFGTRERPQADLLFVHVDLSVVPEEYQAVAEHYPVSVNARVADIRKSVISDNLLTPGDDWQGSVIVKSDLNFGGLPEQMVRTGWLERKSRIWRTARRVSAQQFGHATSPASRGQYQVFDRLTDVPQKVFEDKSVVAEKFLPEVEDGLYHLRMHQFLGDRSVTTRLSSTSPVVKAGVSQSVDRVEPPPEVEHWRCSLKMDYGKLDFLQPGDTPVLIDVNKTVGASLHMDSKELQATRRHLAEGIYAYLR